MAFVFNGGTKKGFWRCGSINAGACGSDPYGAIYANNCSSNGGYELIGVDVWAARRANAWSSSVTIDIYAATESGAVIDLCVSIGTDHMTGGPPYPSQPPASGYSFQKKSVTTDVCALACPTTKLATVTVNEDGTFSIA